MTIVAGGASLIGFTRADHNDTISDETSITHAMRKAPLSRKAGEGSGEGATARAQRLLVKR